MDYDVYQDPPCVGNPSYGRGPGAGGTWPENLPGYVCKTAPFGIHSASRLAKCCSGPVYNITSQTDKDDPAYPMSCGVVCQVDQAFTEPDPDSPDGSSAFDKCVFDAGDAYGEVHCSGPTTPEADEPTFTTTPTGPWMTKSWNDSDTPRAPDSSSAASEASGTQSGSSAMATGQSSATSKDGQAGTQTKTSESPATSSPNAAPRSAVPAKAFIFGATVALLLRYVQ